MKNTANYTEERFEFRAFVTESYAPLMEMKQKDNQAGFNELIGKVLPGIKQYLTRQLEIAIKKHALPQGKYKVDDFVDELYIEAFDHIEEVKEDRHFYSWLFKKADEIFEDITIEEDFDNTFFKNIDDYTQVEWDAMKEEYSTDGDGDLVMLEEFEDSSYRKQDYTLLDVFVENNELDFIKELNEKLSEEEIHQQIDLVLHLLPMSIRTVYELTINQQFDAEEIAKIKEISVQEVERILANAKHIILTSFVKKYLPK